MWPSGAPGPPRSLTPDASHTECELMRACSARPPHAGEGHGPATTGVHASGTRCSRKVNFPFEIPPGHVHTHDSLLTSQESPVPIGVWVQSTPVSSTRAHAHLHTHLSVMSLDVYVCTHVCMSIYTYTMMGQQLTSTPTRSAEREHKCVACV